MLRQSLRGFVCAEARSFVDGGASKWTGCVASVSLRQASQVEKRGYKFDAVVGLFGLLEQARSRKASSCAAGWLADGVMT